MGCLQTTFCALNALIAILALACVGVGIWASVDKDSFTDTLTNLKAIAVATTELKIDDSPADQISNVAILICCIGGVVMIIAGMGCFGAMTNVRRLLGAFFVAMLLISALVIVVAVIVRVYPGEFSEKIAEKFRKYLENGDFKDEVEKYQDAFECCGIDGPRDYEGGRKTPKPDICKTVKEGCVDKFMKDVRNVTGPLFIVLILALVLSLLATAISGYLYRRGDGRAV